MEKQFFISREQYNIVVSTWNKRTKNHIAWQHIVYNILRSKQPDNGFIAKTKNIQGNDPWFAYNKALLETKWYCDIKRNDTFKVIFGIDIPENINEKLGVKK